MKPRASGTGRTACRHADGTGQAKAASEGVEKFMTVVRRHMNFEELTHTLLRKFVEKIVVQ